MFEILRMISPRKVGSIRFFQEIGLEWISLVKIKLLTITEHISCTKKSLDKLRIQIQGKNHLDYSKSMKFFFITERYQILLTLSFAVMLFLLDFLLRIIFQLRKLNNHFFCTIKSSCPFRAPWRVDCKTSCFPDPTLEESIVPDVGLAEGEPIGLAIANFVVFLAFSGKTLGLRVLIFHSPVSLMLWWRSKCRKRYFRLGHWLDCK